VQRASEGKKNTVQQPQSVMIMLDANISQQDL